MNSQGTAGQSILLMSPERVQRSLNRMAYQIAEDNRDASGILMFGLKERGYAVARVLANKLRNISSSEVNLVRLSESSSQKLKDGSDGRNKERYTVVVDDVIFSGRTMMGAVQKIMQQLNSPILRTATLVDRGHRSMPVEATFTGLELPTKLDEHVSVRVDKERVEKVVLSRK